MLKNKKGVSLIISYVLLVGFMVALAITVTLWIRGMAEEDVDILTTKECEMQCDDVFLAASCYQNGVLNISNKGNFGIDKLRVQNSSGVNELEGIGLGGTAEDLNIGEKPISIVPIVDECVCGDKRIEVNECDEE